MFMDLRLDVFLFLLIVFLCVLRSGQGIDEANRKIDEIERRFKEEEDE